MTSLANIIPLMVPELILIGAACALFLIGVINRPAARRFSAVVALSALLIATVVQYLAATATMVQSDPTNAIRITQFAQYVKLLACGVGALFVLLSWPTDREATGNGALNFGTEAGEFFALLLLSISGILIVSSANDLVLLFLGIELASIPTYIMVSVSRPIAVAQEAGVKYFFLGAMSAAILLFGLSYFYGVSGTTNMQEIAAQISATMSTAHPARVSPSSWQMLAAVMVIAGLAFKIAAVPLHFYAGDVYQGAATPVTALLSFVPKTSGMVAIIKILFIAGGGAWALPETLCKLLWVMAVLTMTFGNLLALTQTSNIKRVLAFSSVAHSGYMLVGLTALAYGAGQLTVQDNAIRGVLFYLAAYGIMNAAAFGALMLLPGRHTETAETYSDIAGQGREHPIIGLAMAISCFSLIGLPLTVGFWGKVYLILPALRGGNYWLVIFTMVNAAISAAYYLRIVATMFLKPEPVGGIDIQREALPQSPAMARPIFGAVLISAVGTLLLGSYPAMTEALSSAAATATQVDQRPAPAIETTVPATAVSRLTQPSNVP